MQVTVAATQMACSRDTDANVERAVQLVHRAADAGAQINLLGELFETPYFGIDTQSRQFDLAKPLDEQPTIRRSGLYRRLMTLDGEHVVAGG